MDSSEFFGEEPAERDPQRYDGRGRYLLDADGTGQRSYTRATTLANTLDDGRGLAIWGQRKAAKGVAMSPALTARAAATPLDDRKVWREILDQAEVKSGGDEKREWGSAFHEFHERVPGMSDEEYAAQAVELRVTYERYRAELDRLGITEVLTEFTCVNSAIGTAGKGDAIFRLADGRLVIGDRKTGRVTEYPHSPAVQFAIYANADVLIEFDESGAQHRVPMPEVDKTIALVVDITIGDENTAAVHVYEVNIWAGWYGALLAGQVRRWRNRKDLIRPYHPEFLPSEKALAAAAVEPVQVAAQLPAALDETPRLPPNQAWFEQQAPGQPQPVEPADRPDANTANTEQLGGPMTQPPHAAHPITKQAWSSAEQRNITLNPDGTRADGLTGPQVSAIVQPEAGPTYAKLKADVAESDVDALQQQYKTKAAMQEAGRRVGLTNLSRTRANLAKDMVAHPAWPSLRTALLPVDPVARVQEASDEAAAAYGNISETGDGVDVLSPVVSNAPGPVPPDPEPGFPVNGGTAEDAATEPDYGNEPPGPAADSTVLSANPFRPAAAPAPVAAKTPEDELIERIAAAGSQDEIADIWDHAVNVVKIGWTPRLHQAATIRAKQFEQKG